MKNLGILTLFLAFMGLSQTSQAQIDVTVNPIGILFGDLSAGVDFAVSEKFSVEAQVGFGGDKGGEGTSAYKYRNLGTTGLAKFYFNPNRGADRFYVDGFVKFINRNYDYTDDNFFSDYKQNRLGIGAGLGYKVVSGGGFVFDINIGGGRALLDKTSVDGTTIDWPDIIVTGKLGIGYRFGGGKR
jgi:hypothetical protein